MKQKSGPIRDRGIWIAIAVGLVVRFVLLFTGVEVDQEIIRSLKSVGYVNE